MLALPKRSWLTISLTLALPASRLQAETCYADEDVSKLAGAIRGLEVCEETLKLREEFIETQKLTAVPEVLWWQTPEVVISGIVITASVSVTAAVLFMSQRK